MEIVLNDIENQPCTYPSHCGPGCQMTGMKIELPKKGENKTHPDLFFLV